jgi:KDO II ethanolaminephosphotransferase
MTTTFSLKDSLRFNLSERSVVLLSAVYIAVFLNAVVFARRFLTLLQNNDLTHSLAVLVTEVLLCFSLTVVLLTVLTLLGRHLFKLLLGLTVLLSVAASYYMTFFNVVIGYGVVQAVLTTDIDLSKESVGFWFFTYVFVLGLLPLVWAGFCLSVNNWQKFNASNWKKWLQLKFQALLTLFVAAIIFTVAYFVIEQVLIEKRQDKAVLISPATLAAHLYLPSNWVAGLAMSASNTVQGAVSERQLKNMATTFHYQAPKALDDVHIVLVIGESTRSMNFSLLGYNRPNNDLLSQQKNLIAFKAKSCNTSTKLSLQCMFVRPEGVKDNGVQAPVISEQPVFSILKSLGFTIDLFAMQSEVWFYNSVNADFYKIREVIAAKAQNIGQPQYDEMLIPELKESVNQHAKGKHLVILHTKGSHYLYTSRYPRSFARYQPECQGLDSGCTKQEMINSYDNSILYLDYFLNQVYDTMKDKKALVIYVPDHGESIEENNHFHATPKPLAPPEQTSIPLMVWVSPAFLSQPEYADLFTKLKNKSDQVVAHENLFDSILGCLGIESNNGGINPSRNLCH